MDYPLKGWDQLPSLLRMHRYGPWVIFIHNRSDISKYSLCCVLKIQILELGKTRLRSRCVFSFTKKVEPAIIATNKQHRASWKCVWRSDHRALSLEIHNPCIIRHSGKLGFLDRSVDHLDWSDLYDKNHCLET